MTKTARPFKEVSNELLKDAECAALYLEECLADGDIELFKLALKNVADARLGSMSILAQKTNLGRESLYKALSKTGNPKLETLKKVLSATGLRLSIVPEIEETKPSVTRQPIKGIRRHSTSGRLEDGC